MKLYKTRALKWDFTVSTSLLLLLIYQGPVVRRVDNFTQLINSNLVDKIGAFFILVGQQANFIHGIGIYPLDKVIHSSYNRAQLFSLSLLRRDVA